MQNSNTEVEAVQNNIADDHYSDQPEPDKTHHDEASSKQFMHLSSFLRVRRQYSGSGDSCCPKSSGVGHGTMADFAVHEHSEEQAEERIQSHKPDECEEAI